METGRNAPAEVGHTGQGGEKSDSNPLAELAGTGQCGAGIGKSRMASGGTTKKEKTNGIQRNTKKEKPDSIRRKRHGKKRASGGGAHRTRRGKSDSNPLAELAGTGQRGAGIGKSRMASGGIRRRKSRIQSGGMDTGRHGEKPDDIRRKRQER